MRKFDNPLIDCCDKQHPFVVSLNDAAKKILAALRQKNKPTGLTLVSLVIRFLAQPR